MLNQTSILIRRLCWFGLRGMPCGIYVAMAQLYNPLLALNAQIRLNVKTVLAIKENLAQL